MAAPSRAVLPLVLVVLALAAPTTLHAQGTRADYERAATITRELAPLVLGQPSAPTWLSDSVFWYRVTVEGGHAYRRVDAAVAAQAPLFDHDAVAASLSEALDTVYSPVDLPFDGRAARFSVEEDGRTLRFVVDERWWSCDVASSACARGEAVGGSGGGGGQGREEPSDVRPSPDGRWEALILDHNVAIRPADRDTDSTIVLSFDGAADDHYTLGSLRWSPDSRKLMAYRRRPGSERIVHYIRTSPDDQLQPRLETTKTLGNEGSRYLKPGDVVDRDRPVLFDVESRRQTVIDDALFPNPYHLTRPAWREDSRAFTFQYNERGHQNYRVIEVDAATGAARALIDERPETFFNYDGTLWRFDVDDGREILWRSERDGWKHLWLYDGVTGRVKNQVTKGPWVVRDVDSVDVGNRQIWFRASGMNPDQDPYYVHHYRVGFDGTGLVAYTEADGTHEVSWSPGRTYYVDTWSRVDQPPVMELRRASDRRVLMEVARADDARLRDAGWAGVEPFVAKGRDGVTDIHGIIVRPTDFDPSRRYPVIEKIYAGPQDSFVPKGFGLMGDMLALAELGFVVVQIDGMGTMNRSKAFHDVAWKNLGDAGFPDRILWHRAVAERYAWYDTTRVGIFGGSAGGQNAMGALLFHPEFYDVAVSAVGCHDNRMDKIWWNELWMSWPIGPQYSASSNVDNAHLLQGRLLLVVGELDTNVDPASTYQVVNALLEADKDVDLMVIPNGGHGSGGAVGTRKRNDYFVRHLLGVEPPAWNRSVAAAEDAERGAEEALGAWLLPPASELAPRMVVEWR